MDKPSEKIFKVLILEDRYGQRMQLEEVLIENGYKDVISVGTVEAAKKEFDNKNPDLAILDINIQDEEDGGIKVGHYIREKRRIPIIYSTAFPQKAVEAKFTFPVAILVKPYRDEAILLNLESAIHQFYGEIQSFPNLKLTPNLIIAKGVLRPWWGKYKYDSIICIDASGNDVIFNLAPEEEITSNNEREVLKIISTGIGQCETHFPVNNFIRIHQSHIISMTKVVGYRSSERKVVLVNGLERPVSNKFKELFEQKYFSGN